jgi:hypothetical protein
VTDICIELHNGRKDEEKQKINVIGIFVFIVCFIFNCLHLLVCGLWELLFDMY